MSNSPENESTSEIENKDSPIVGCGYGDVRTGNPRLQYEKSS